MKFVHSVLVLLFFLMFAFVIGRPSLAQEEPRDATSPALLTSTESAKADAEYMLPYPGILPDSPFYKLKAARDWVVNFLISDTLKKSEFSLLQADKRLSAGAALFKKDKKELAEETISKGQNYLEFAIAKAAEAEKQGRDINNLKENLVRAVKKHKQLLSGLRKDAPKNLKEQFANLEKRMDDFDTKVNTLGQ